MVEFSDLLIFTNTLEIFSRLGEAGMTPVITHPERNGLLRQRIEQIAQWVDAGACVQLTAQSLTGTFGRRAIEFSKALIDRGLVQFVASDAHDCENRPPRLDLAYQWLKEQYGEAPAEVLCATNPKATLTGDPLERHQYSVTPEPRKWYQIWR